MLVLGLLIPESFLPILVVLQSLPPFPLVFLLLPPLPLLLFLHLHQSLLLLHLSHLHHLFPDPGLIQLPDWASEGKDPSIPFKIRLRDSGRPLLYLPHPHKHPYPCQYPLLDWLLFPLLLPLKLVRLKVVLLSELMILLFHPLPQQMSLLLPTSRLQIFVHRL